MDYAGEGRHLFKDLGFETVSLRIKTIGSCGSRDIPCLCSVTGDTAVLTHLLKGNPLSIIGHDHGKACCSTLECLHLHDHRDLCHAFFYRLFNCSLLT